MENNSYKKKGAGMMLHVMSVDSAVSSLKANSVVSLRDV
jgi:hypothetical protein